MSEPDTKLVERVARAMLLHDCDGDRNLAKSVQLRNGRIWVNFLGRAKAAIQAMQEDES